MLLTGVLWSQLHADALIAGCVWAATGFVSLLVITKGFRSSRRASTRTSR